MNLRQIGYCQAHLLALAFPSIWIASRRTFDPKKPLSRTKTIFTTAYSAYSTSILFEGKTRPAGWLKLLDSGQSRRLQLSNDSSLRARVIPFPHLFIWPNVLAASDRYTSPVVPVSSHQISLGSEAVERTLRIFFSNAKSILILESILTLEPSTISRYWYSHGWASFFVLEAPAAKE